ncbi:MAG: LytR C-terminal domain-containing protein [Gemmatimonadota bacterium]
MVPRAARVGLIAAGAILLTAGIVLAARMQRDRVPGHAYAIPSADHRIVIEVLNGNGRNGLARTVTRQLRQQGLDVVFFGSTDKTDSTEILVRRGDAGMGSMVAKALGVGRVRVEQDTLRRVDVSVILGGDFTPPADLHP